MATNRTLLTLSDIKSIVAEKYGVSKAEVEVFDSYCGKLSFKFDDSPCGDVDVDDVTFVLQFDREI